MSNSNQFSKKIPKGPIKYQIELTEEQKEAKKLIEDSKVTILYGLAGSSKTLCSIYTAINLLFKKEINKIYITRPSVPMEQIGFLPGSASEKQDPYLIGIKQNVEKIVGREKANKLFIENDIETLPFAFIQGITVDDFLLIDEIQNATKAQIKMALLRLGKNGKIVLTGDINQVMLKNEKDSGFGDLLKISNKLEGLGIKEMKSNYRDPFIEQIIELYK